MLCETLHFSLCAFVLHLKVKSEMNKIGVNEFLWCKSCFHWQMLKHGRAGVPMEVMGLMLGEFVDDYTVRVIDVFAMPQSGTVSFYTTFTLTHILSPWHNCQLRTSKSSLRYEQFCKYCIFAEDHNAV